MPDLMPPGFMVGNSFFNNFQGGPVGGGSPANVAANMYTPRAAQPTLPPLSAGQSGTATTSASASGSVGDSSGTRRTVLPSDWLGTANSGMQELLHEYDTSGSAFDTSEYDAASRKQQARDLAVGMTSAQNAAAEYTARTRQAGGTASGSGLVKAQGIIASQDAAGKAEAERAKYDIAQREAAATHAGQIANLLGNLRTNYLSTLAGTDTTGNERQAGMQSGSQTSISDKGSGGGGGGGGDWFSITPSGMGSASGVDPWAANSRTGQYSTPTSATNLTGQWNAANFGG